MKIGSLFLFVLIAFSSCDLRSKERKAADELAAKMPGTGNMNAGKQNYTLYIPKGWTTEHRSAYGIDYYFLLAPQTPDDPKTNINLITENMQNLPLEVFMTKTIESVSKGIPSATNFSQGEIVADELKGNWYSYTMAPQGIKALIVSYIFPKNGVAYVITGGTTLQNALRYRDLFDTVARSFRFIEPVPIKKASNN